jgi:succinoglycan biosynthesis protein ExoV
LKLAYQVNDNFGDRLNEWFWHRAAPSLIDDDASSLMFGMGTILDDWFVEKLPAAPPKIVIGSGAGGRGSIAKAQPNWHFYGVRGPLTASYFGLEADMIIGDPAILLNEFDDLYSTGDRKGVGFMPHCWSLDDWNWQETCQEAGLVYIDPRGEPTETIRKISQLDRLITEAMHGAIVADAVRVPWTAVRISHRFWSSKWSDWAGALGMSVDFKHVHQLHDQRNESILKRAKGAIKRKGALIGINKWASLPASSRFEVNRARHQLEEIAASVTPQLSSGAALGTAVDRIKRAIERCTADKQAGRFS